MAKKLRKTERAGTRLRARNKDGAWRKKRSDARAREIRARFRSQGRHFSDSVDVIREDRDAG